MSSRDSILQRIRTANERDPLKAPADAMQASPSWNDLVNTFPEEVQTRLKKPVRHTQVEVAGSLTDALIEQMEAVQMSVVRLQSLDDVVEAVDWYLQEEGLSGDLCIAPSLDQLQWKDGTRFGPALADTATSVTNALVAVAETGSIALASSDQSPSTLNYLPENHIVVLHESQIVKATEDVWDCLREKADIPRAVNLVTGPSRTGDIEQTIELGAHGPRRMHVLLVAAAPSNP